MSRIGADTFGLTDTQRDVQDAVSRLARTFDDEYWTKCDEAHEFPWDFYEAFAKGGWLGIAIPEEYGGSGLGISEASILLEEVAASGAAMNGCTPMHLTIFGLNPIVKHGSEEMKREVLPAAVDGSLHVCFAVTEPDAGTDTTRITTFAKRDGGDYVVNGKKVWITKAAQSQKMLLVARTSERREEKPTDGISLFLIDVNKEAMGLQAIPKMGRNAVASYEVFLDDYRIPGSALVGEEGNGFRQLLDGLNPERILLSHEAIGIGRVALDRAIDYANERVVFNRPIGKNQGIAFPLAEALARLDAARLMARRAGQMYDAGEACGREANMGKFLAAEAGFTAADVAMQTHGGMGYAREFNVERYFRESRVMRLAPISQASVLGYLSQHVLGLPRSY